MKTCHKPTEVHPNLWLCSRDQVGSFLRGDGRNIDVLVPLHNLDGDIWDTGFRGEILYYPTPDFGVLPQDVLGRLVEDVISRITAGLPVLMFCLGGHGRTGYAAAAVLGKLLPEEDPIAFVREKYCSRAVESAQQVRALADFLGRPELVEKHEGSKAATTYNHTSVTARTDKCVQCKFLDLTVVKEGKPSKRLCRLLKSWREVTDEGCSLFERWTGNTGSATTKVAPKAKCLFCKHLDFRQDADAASKWVCSRRNVARQPHESACEEFEPDPDDDDTVIWEEV